jgi:hypothetical protein
VLNRAVRRATLFAKATDCDAIVRELSEALDWVAIRLLAYCVMPNHWHLVVWPERDGDLSEFMRWLTLTHTQRWAFVFVTPGSQATFIVSVPRIQCLKEVCGAFSFSPTSPLDAPTVLQFSFLVLRGALI